MVHVAADRCIDPDDHGRSRGPAIPVGKEAAGWPWLSPSPRATTSATSGRPRPSPEPDTPLAGTTSTPPWPGNRLAGGGDPERKPSASPRTKSSNASHRRTTHRAGTPGRPGDPPARRLHRHHRLVLQVHLGAARLDPENERRARLAGDQQATAYWAGQEEAFQEVLHRANRAALKYLQAWAERIPGVPDPDRRAYLAQIAAMMDDRTNASARMPPGPSPPGRSRLSARCQTIRPPGRSGSARQR